MNKHLLIFAWEYNGYHSKQGTALSRRIRQVAESFKINGWEVSVVHKDQADECLEKPFVLKTESTGVKRIPVKLQGILEDYTKNALVRKIETLRYVALHGDRTHKWAKDVVKNFNSFNIAKPDLILSFYTPRAPLYLGHYFSKKLGVPWIADIQDPVLAGISESARSFCARWMKNILKSAKTIVHISPEWAAIDSRILGLKIHTIRHAIPDLVNTVDPVFSAKFKEDYGNAFTIFYGGSLTPRIQSLGLLKQAIDFGQSKNRAIKILIAANNNVYEAFKDQFDENLVKHLGWLTPETMNQYILNCNCTLVIPWSKERIGIPSKFYELCSYPKPIWIIGNDLGAFKSLLSEWQHPDIPIDNVEYQQKALILGMNGDYSHFFNLQNCKGKYIRACDLFAEYQKLI